MYLSRFTLSLSSMCLALHMSSPHPLAAQEPTPRPTFVDQQSDLNQDNVVDEEDLMIFMQDWGKMTGPEKVITIDMPGLPEGARPLRLVRIPAGSFQMGSPYTERGRTQAEWPSVHPVNIGYDFYMGETEVTQAQWRAMMGSNPASGFGVGDDHPAYNVSWNDIRRLNGFLDRLNALGQGTFRLPSEAEWEYACRAGTTTRFFFGDSLECGDWNENCAAGTLPGNRSDYMWYLGNNSPSGSKPVAGKLPNAFGLFDMHGNVSEWCEDSYLGTRLRVFRGGDWSSWVSLCRSASRSATYPHEAYKDMGFRVVRFASP